MFDPGNFNTLVEFYRPSATQTLTPMGASMGTPVRAFTRDAMLMFLSGQERIEASQPDADVGVKIVVWHDNETREIGNDWFVKSNGKTFGVAYTRDVPGGEQAERVEIFCSVEG